MSVLAEIASMTEAELNAKVSMFIDIPICKTRHLENRKYAVIGDGVIYVSPAVWTLADQAEHEDLIHLIKHLPLVEYSDSCLSNLHDQNK